MSIWRILASAGIVVFTGLLAYLFHPALNPHSVVSWIFLAIVVFAVYLIILILTGDGTSFYDYFPVIATVTAAVFAVIIVGGMFISSKLVAAGAYADILQPTESTYAEHADDLQISAIPLMDTDSAKLFGNRELGSLDEVVSQFDDDPNYHQIDYKGVPTKVTAVDYAGFFRWLNNNSVGTPGYVSVDPVDQSADYVALAGIDGAGDSMLYTEGAFFNHDLDRHLWMQFPNKIFGENHFELDEEGHPFFVTPFYKFNTLFGAKDVEGIVITDPFDGTSTEYTVSDAPEWVDDIYNGELIIAQATDHWMLNGGFWNSVFAKNGCKKTSDDYGFVDIDGHIWIYTGVTSANGDASNVGFLLSSERTRESYYIPLASADEKSAMASAEGQVQQYGYTASWPSLVSIDGQPTYVMVLKDDSGVVRMFAMVNAESYNVVACDYTLDAVKASYEQRMRNAGIKFSADGQDMPDTVAEGQDGSIPDAAIEFAATAGKVILADEGGDTYAYIGTDDGKVYKAKFAEHPVFLMGLESGTKFSGTARQADDGSMEVLSFAGETTSSE